MNSRAIVTLGLLLGAAAGKSPQTWLAEFHQRLRAAQAKAPADTAVKVVLLGAAAFYAAEHGKNPKITSFEDALVYVSTSLSVGGGGIVARTAVGKAISSALVTYGPALTMRVFDPPASPDAVAATDATLSGVAERLDAILAELVQQRLATAEAPAGQG